MAQIIREQIYRNITTGEIAQIRQELDDGSVQWTRNDGSVWDSHMDDPSARQLRPPRKELK